MVEDIFRKTINQVRRGTLCCKPDNVALYKPACFKHLPGADIRHYL